MWKLYTSVTCPLERIHWWKEHTVTAGHTLQEKFNK